MIPNQTGPAGYQVQPNMWQGGFDQLMHDGTQGQSPSDSWSNSSASAVPMTMNVEDWSVYLSSFLPAHAYLLMSGSNSSASTVILAA